MNKKYNILIVSDENSEETLMPVLLRKQGYEVLRCTLTDWDAKPEKKK